MWCHGDQKHVFLMWCLLLDCLQGRFKVRGSWFHLLIGVACTNWDGQIAGCYHCRQSTPIYPWAGCEKQGSAKLCTWRSFRPMEVVPRRKIWRLCQLLGTCIPVESHDLFGQRICQSGSRKRRWKWLAWFWIEHFIHLWEVNPKWNAIRIWKRFFTFDALKPKGR